MTAFSPSFLHAFSVVVGLEGSFSCDALDAGNWTGGAVDAGVRRGTKYGISAAAFPTLDIRDLTLDQAMAIYRVDYWDRIAGDSLPAALALMLFDCAVNQGVGFAARTLQRHLSACAVDGVIGPQTIAAVKRFPSDARLLRLVAVDRALSYARDAGFSRYGRGWFNRLLRVLTDALSPSLGDDHA